MITADKRPSIIYETQDFIIVYKPAGLSVHNDKGHDLLSLTREKAQVAELLAVHRLDLMTSGLLLLAKNSGFCALASKELSQGKFAKTYFALVRRPRGKSLPLHGKWQQEMTKKAEGGKFPLGASSQRVACESEFWLEKSGSRFDLLRLFPHTGRKHQLRRHCVVNNFPILGDQRYGGKREVWKDYDRIALHAAGLKIPAIGVYPSQSFWFSAPEDFYPTAEIRSEFEHCFSNSSQKPE